MFKAVPRKILIFCLSAALPLLLMAVIFNFSLIFDDLYLFGTSQEILGYIIQAEFLAAASGILIILPLLIQAQSRLLRIIQLGVFIALGWAFAWIAFNIDGTGGMLFYALLVFITYGGCSLFVFDWYSGSTRTYISLLRWSMAIFLYFSLQLSFNLESDIAEWKNTNAVVPFGATFFYVLFLLELILYPPLTYYLEGRLSEENKFSDAVDDMEKRKKAFYKMLKTKPG